jgi:hypothetical protein
MGEKTVALFRKMVVALTVKVKWKVAPFPKVDIRDP